MNSTDLRTTTSSAPVSAVLIAANVMVFAAVTVEGRFLESLALPPDWAGVADRPWTLLTVFFTAEVLLHVALAVVVIGLFGPKLERAIGSVHVLAVYVLAGLAGSLAIVTTASVTGIDGPSVGASAAFLGLVGALAACSREAWGKLQVGTWVVVVVAVQFAAPVLSEVTGVGSGIGDWTSSAAHLIGLGVGAGYAYRLRTRTTSGRREPSDSAP